MINLVPVSAKKKLQQEYWVRALSVWGVLWASALTLGCVSLLPSYVLLSQQVDVYAASAATASEKVAEYEDASDQLRQANVQAQDISQLTALPRLSNRIQIIKTLSEDDVILNTLRIQRAVKGGLNPIVVTGIAGTRESLQSFRDRLLSESWVSAVDFPISNLAQGEDIEFTITIEVNEDETI